MHFKVTMRNRIVIRVNIRRVPINVGHFVSSSLRKLAAVGLLSYAEGEAVTGDTLYTKVWPMNRPCYIADLQDRSWSNLRSLVPGKHQHPGFVSVLTVTSNYRSHYFVAQSQFKSAI